MSNFWYNQRVVVTGGQGFLGGFVISQISKKGCMYLVAIPRSQCDLRDAQHIHYMLKWNRPTIIIHLAAECGGIEANRQKPGEFFYDNAIMGIQLIEQARSFGVQKIVVLGTVCAYPKFTPTPFKEEDLWSGYPEETNAPYALAKKMLLVQLQAYRQQYGFNGIYLMPANLYGPGDNFDLETSHVIPAIIRKMVEAKRENKPYVELWGTGHVSREFLYAPDCAEGILLAAEKYDKPEPVNLGTGNQIRIRQLAEMIKKMISYEGEIEWDPSRPDGQPQRQLDTTRAFQEFGFKANTSFEDGINQTIEYYLKSNEHRHTNV